MKDNVDVYCASVEGMISETMKKQLQNSFLLLSQHKILLCIFFLATLIRVYVLVSIGRQIGIESLLTATGDTTRYVAGAQSLITATPGFELVAFSFGPGYSLFLAPIFALCGVHAFPVVILQILLASLSCCMLYLLGKRVTDRESVGIIAGLLGVISVTGTMLSCLVLSDTLYFFLFTSGLVLFLKGIDENRAGPAILSALLFGYATLTRTIGQFWPLAMLVILIVMVRDRQRPASTEVRNRRSSLTIGLVAIGLVVAIEGAWIVRNKFVHDIPTMAFISAGGPATIAALGLHPGDENNYRQTMDKWVTEYLTAHNTTTISPEEHFRLLRNRATETFLSNPTAVLKAYTKLSWTNINDIDYLHRDILPDWNPWSTWLEGIAKTNYLNYGWFALSILGLMISAFTCQWRQLAILGVCYFYFALLCGAFPWQGSRLFYQAETASTILTALVVIWICDRLRSVTRHFQS